MYGAFFIGLDFVSVKKKIKKELGQYPAALKSPLVNNSHCTVISERCGQSWHQSRDQQITKAWFYSNPLCSVLLILILISFLHCIFLLVFLILYMTVLRIKREKEKLIIRFKYSQAAERNDFTFTRIMVFILFFSCLVCSLKRSMKVLIVATMTKRHCLLFACCVQQLATKVGSTDRCMATPGVLYWSKT